MALALSGCLATGLLHTPLCRSAALRTCVSTACMTPHAGDDYCATSPPPVMQLAKLACPTEADAVLLSEMLLEVGALYVSLSDADAGSDAEVPLFAVHPSDAPDGAMILTDAPEAAAADGGYDPHLMETWDELMSARRLWANAALEVGFSADANVEAALLLCAASAEIALPRFTIEAVGKRDWVSEVQSNWPPVMLPGCLTIRFPWHTDADVAALGDEAPPASVTLHPGMAFGTGEHATTQLCCAALLDSELEGATVLDYGSGSGVLAFAALLFGASRAVRAESAAPPAHHTTHHPQPHARTHSSTAARSIIAARPSPNSAPLTRTFLAAPPR